MFNVSVQVTLFTNAYDSGLCSVVLLMLLLLSLMNQRCCCNGTRHIMTSQYNSLQYK